MREMLAGCFAVVLRLSLTGTFVCMVVCLLRLALRRAPKVFAYGLWMLVFLRFACPFALNSPVSLIPEWDVLWESVSRWGQEDAVLSGQDAGSPQMNFLHEEEEEAEGTKNPGAQVYPLPAAGSVNPEPGERDKETALTEVLLPAAVPEAEMPDGREQRIARPWAVAVWLGGMAVLLFIQLGKSLRWKRGLARITASEEEGNEVPGIAASEEGICEAPGIVAPFVMGMRHPRIYLPQGLTEETRNLVLLHERTHIRRRDYLIKPLCFLIACVHWFNPFVWLAWRLMNMDMELSCDEAVLNRLQGQKKKDYAQALLSFADSSVYAGYLAFGEPYAKKRIRNVLRYRRPAYRVSLVLTVLCLALSGCLLTNPLVGQDTGSDGKENPGQKTGTEAGTGSLLAGEAAGAEEHISVGTLTDINEISADRQELGEEEAAAADPAMRQTLDFLTDYLREPRHRALLELGAWQREDCREMDFRELGKRSFLLDLAHLLAEPYDGKSLSEAEQSALSQAGLDLDEVVLKAEAQTVREVFEDASGLTFEEKWWSEYFGGWYSYDGSFYLEAGEWEQNALEPVRCTRAYVDGEGLLRLSCAYDVPESSGVTDMEGEVILTKESGRWRLVMNTVVISRTEQPEEDPGEAEAYRAAQEAWWASYEIGSTSPQITESSQSWEADLTHDGQPERLVFDWGYFDLASWGIFAVLDADGQVLYKVEAGRAHMGWENVYLCRLDGQDYLFQYNPTCYQGWCDYSYELYCLDAAGEKIVADSGLVSFYASEGNPELEVPVMDIAAMTAFAEKVNTYMEASYLLVSTDENAIGEWPEDAASDLFITSTPQKPIRLWEIYWYALGERGGPEKPDLAGLPGQLEAFCESRNLPYK